LTIEPFGPFASTVKVLGTEVKAGPEASVTVTWKLPVAVFPAVSLTVQFTVVVPIVNVAPDAGLQFGDRDPETRSLAVAEYVTVLPADESASTVVLDGKFRVGFVVSWTVTLNDMVAVLFAASVAVQVTGVVPIGKVEPDDGHETVGGVPLSSCAVTENVTAAPLLPVASVVMSPCGSIVGGVWSW
jgi:hypothetical protein